MAGYRGLSDRLAAWTGTMGAFSRALDRDGTPYLSFSKLVSVEFCSNRYLLEYVERKRLRPPPDFFCQRAGFSRDGGPHVPRFVARQSAGRGRLARLLGATRTAPNG